MRPGHRLTVLAGLAASLCALVRGQEPSAPGAQADPPPITFTVDVNYVEVSAVVTDAQGRVVTGLSQADFQILEDGRPQRIAGFSAIDLPTRRTGPASADAPVPDVWTNAGGFQGRLYLIVLDDLHTDIARTGLVKAAARRFIERGLSDGDLAAVVATSGRFEAVQDFTSDPRLLVAAADTFVGQKLRSAVIEKLDSYQQQIDLTGQDPGQIGKPVDDALDVQRGQRARNTLLTIRNLVESLSSVYGRRKALVYFGEGIDYNTSNFEPWREIAGNARRGVGLEDALRDAIAAASRANVSIYAVDPRGLSNAGDAGIEINSVPQDPNLRLDNVGLVEEVRLSQDSLRVLAEQTGGTAAVNENDLQLALDRVVRENSAYYMLGYYPANGTRDGRFRRIDVRVNKPGLQVRARKGYVVPGRGEKPARRSGPKLEGSAALADAMSRPIQTAGLSMQATAAAYRGSGATATVAVAITLDGAGLTLVDKDGWIENLLEVSVAAADSKGAVRGSEQFDLNVRIRPESRGTLQSTGFRVLAKLELPPGRYRLHIGVREAGTGAVGTIFADLAVPDFATPALAMGSLMVSSVETGGIPTGRAEQLRGRLPLMPATRRAFRAADELTLYTEVYANGAGSQAALDVTASVLSADRQVVHRQERGRGQPLENQESRLGFGATMPLKGLERGDYILRVESTSREPGVGSVTREVAFRVTP